MVRANRVSQRVLRNCRIARMLDQQSGYGLLEDGALVLEEGRIAWVGRQDALPEPFAQRPATDLEGRLVTPAFIDCHTHIVHGGNRAKEFEMRLNGESYEAIAKAGGGIISTVSATRLSSEDTLLNEALPRVDALIAEGVSTIEIKSGYGLDRDTELKMLRVARRISKVRQVEVVTSFLGAHAIPAEYKGRAAEYMSDVCLPTLRAAVAEGLVDGVDAFCEGIAFQPEELVPLFELAQSLNIPMKLHAEQLSNLGGRNSRPGMGRSRRIIWNILMKAVFLPWRGQAWSPFFCRGPITRCAKRSCRQSICLENIMFQWRWPVMQIPALRR